MPYNLTWPPFLMYYALFIINFIFYRWFINRLCYTPKQKLKKKLYFVSLRPRLPRSPRVDLRPRPRGVELGRVSKL